MALVPYDPFPTFWSAERDIDRMLRRFYTREAPWSPAVDLKRVGDKVVARFDLPGMKEDAVKVEFDDGVLTVSGERTEEKEERNDAWYHRERTFGAFSRSFRLPAGADAGAITAHFADGVLEVTVPAATRPKPKRIPILQQAKKEEKGRKEIAVH